MVDLIAAVRDAIETEGLGPSEWKRRDCISFVRAVIAAHGVEPSFKLPEELKLVRSERGAVKKAIKVFGSLTDGWLNAIAREPHLEPYEGPVYPRRHRTHSGASRA